MQLPQLCQQATQRMQQLQQALQQLQAAGAADCEGAGSEPWRQQVLELDAALERQLQEVQAFDAVYQQVRGDRRQTNRADSRNTSVQYVFAAVHHTTSPAAPSHGCQGTSRPVCTHVL